jgi:MFS family permease
MGRFDLSFTNPIFTIIAGVIVAFTLMFIPYLGYVIGPLIGGFIATYFANEKKIIYGLFVGIGAIILLFIYSSSEPISNLDILIYIIVSIPISIIPAIIGSYIGKRTMKLL